MVASICTPETAATLQPIGGTWPPFGERQLGDAYPLGTYELPPDGRAIVTLHSIALQLFLASARLLCEVLTLCRNIERANHGTGSKKSLGSRHQLRPTIRFASEGTGSNRKPSWPGSSTSAKQRKWSIQEQPMHLPKGTPTSEVPFCEWAELRRGQFLLRSCKIGPNALEIVLRNGHSLSGKLQHSLTGLLALGIVLDPVGSHGQLIEHAP